MRHALKTPAVRRLTLAAACAGLAVTAVPAFAQSYDAPRTVDELTVVGRLGPDGPNTLSRAVDIADLDLRYDRDVREMQRRVRHVAHQLCDELGERGGAGVTPSCEDAAVRDAQRQTRIAIAQARSPTYYAYAAPPAYVPYAGEYAPPASATVPYDPPDLN
jgi:UrcA family protein